MKTEVALCTYFGNVSVSAEIEYKITDDFLAGKEDAWKNVEGVLNILREDHVRCYQEHKYHEIRFGLAIIEDINELRKQNEEYAAKEENGRHHVDLKSLKIEQIWIDGKYLRIEWCFTDCYGDERIFMGNQYPLHKGCKYGDDVFHTSLPTTLKVYF